MYIVSDEYKTFGGESSQCSPFFTERIFSSKLADQFPFIYSITKHIIICNSIYIYILSRAHKGKAPDIIYVLLILTSDRGLLVAESLIPDSLLSESEQ